MTYNFDPDKWYDIERAALEDGYQKDNMDKQAFTCALDDLDRRYGEMLDRLDGTYQIPK